jgi:hypothetical protein
MEINIVRLNSQMREFLTRLTMNLESCQINNLYLMQFVDKDFALLKTTSNYQDFLFSCDQSTTRMVARGLSYKDYMSTWTLLHKTGVCLLSLNIESHFSLCSIC